jgi:hypothetical protein
MGAANVELSSHEIATVRKIAEDSDVPGGTLWENRYADRVSSNTSPPQVNVELKQNHVHYMYV